MIMINPIKWTRKDGILCSSDGRFSIHPEFQGTCSPQSYTCVDSKTSCRTSGDRVRDLKRDCDKLVEAEFQALLCRIENALCEASAEFNHPRFTDRHGSGPRMAAALKDARTLQSLLGKS